MAHKRKSIVTAKNILKSYNGTPVLEDVSFSIPAESLTVIIGPNGAGKTTLVKILLGLEEPTEGTVLVEGKLPHKVRKRIAYVPQRVTVDKNTPITVGEFLSLARCEHTAHQTIEAARSALDDVALVNVWDKQIHQLSGGQFQRLMVARALMHDKDILIFDEPAANVDVAGEQTIYDLILRLQKERKTTTLIVSHELDVVFRYADQVLCINKRLVCHGVPKKVLTSSILEEMYGHHAGAYHHHCEK